ncbi:peptide-O-fucosyltransferase [Entomortierella parvispora]|uniref:GDP-fucose protein O-fucosyltransferase 2 n=1 Tax=Entomortierella parvispora TaxID=205924 RepID=A0A9P3HFR1_9FUNG|nr:peptide-O-fucosyltransferase [Entomortierella parvispora]
MATSPKFRSAMLPRYSSTSAGAVSSRRHTPRQLIVLIALLLLVTSGSMLVFHAATGGSSSSSSGNRHGLGCNKDEDFSIIRWERKDNNIISNNKYPHDNDSPQFDRALEQGGHRIKYDLNGENRDAGSPWNVDNNSHDLSNDKHKNNEQEQPPMDGDRARSEEDEEDMNRLADDLSPVKDGSNMNGGYDSRGKNSKDSSVPEDEEDVEGIAEDTEEEEEDIVPFEDTLDQLSDEKFLTYLPYAGITNQFYGILRGLEVAKSLGRTLIIPPITASSHDKSKQNQPWSKFLDLEKFKELTGAKVVEYHNLRDVDTAAYSTFKCHITCGFGSKREIDFTAKGFLKQWKFNHSLSRLSVDANKIETIAKVLNPYKDDKFLCISNTYKISIPDKSEWKRFGQHLHFTAELEDFVAEFLDRTLEKRDPVYDSKLTQSILPTQRYIAIHARRGDFAQYCASNFPGPKMSSCLPSTEDFSRRVEKVQNMYNPTGALSEIMPVFVATNEKRPEELKKFADLGWTYLDHERIGSAERLGVFGPMMVDQVLMAHAQALIGIHMSTFSRVGALRQLDWHKRKMEYM